MYIRTKDGRIVDTTKYPEHPASWSVQASDYALTIKQSENLEELCDEFVLYDNQLNTYGVFDKKVITFKWLQNNLELYKGMTIYGAIWTSKGLIYVAKMNEKGEIELI